MTVPAVEVAASHRPRLRLVAAFSPDVPGLEKHGHSHLLHRSVVRLVKPYYVGDQRRQDITARSVLWNGAGDKDARILPARLHAGEW